MSNLQPTKLTIVGAGYVGSTCAHLAALKDLAPEIVLIDVLEGRPQGIALDLNQSAALEGFQARVVGTNEPADTAHSDVVIVTAGRPRKPGMSRSDLLEVNGRIACEVADYVRDRSPDAVVIVVSNPLDAMVALVRQRTGFSARRVIGMAGALDSARFSWFLSEATGAAVQDVRTMVLGAHGDSMVPVPAWCTVGGIPAADLIPREELDGLAHRTKHGGAEIVQLLKTGSAWYAPASGAVAMAQAILRDAGRLMPCTCLLNGEYGIEGLPLGVPVVLGKNGVERILEVPLRNEARMALHKTAAAIEQDVEALRDLGLM